MTLRPKVGMLLTMNPKSNLATLLVTVLVALAWIVWPSCAVVSLPGARKPVEGRKKSEFTELKSNLLRREEVFSRLGKPDAFHSRERVACYRVNEVTARNLCLLFYVIPIPVTYDMGIQKSDWALIQFDERDRVKRSGWVTEANYWSGEEVAAKWLGLEVKRKEFAPFELREERRR